jgi:5-methylcytosine-specific restriction protein A
MQRAPRLQSCGCIVPAGQRCRHARARDRERPTARQRGYDTAYQVAAAEFLKTHKRCACGAPAVLVRHRISIRLRPDLRMDQSNWLPGCHSCNVKDAHRDKREGRGVVGTFDDRGRDRPGPRRETPEIFSSRVEDQN